MISKKPFSGLATSRRNLLASTLIYATSLTVRPSSAIGKERDHSMSPTQGSDPTTSVTTKDGVQIFYKDWGAKSAQPDPGATLRTLLGA